MISGTIQLYKHAYSGLTKESWYLSLVMFINRSGTMVVPFMTIYCIQKLHFSIIQAGIVMAMFGLGSITGAFIGGKLTDSTGFYRVQLSALILGGSLFILVGFITSFPFLCTGCFLLSLFNESFRPANSAAIACYSKPENRTRSYSLNRLAINLGWAFGGSLGGMLASVNYHLLFWVDGLTNIIAALLMVQILPAARNRVIEPLKLTAGKPGSAYKDRVYLIFITLTILFATCFFQFFTLQPVFFKTQWHLNERLIGLLMASNGILIVFTEMVIIHHLEKKKHALYFVCIGVALSGVAFAMLITLPQGIFTAFLCVFLITYGEILSMPFMNSFWISRTSENNRGQYAALYTMAWSGAQILAPLTGSLVINYYGFSGLWLAIFSICLFDAAGFLLLMKLLTKIPPGQKKQYLTADFD